MAHGNGEADQTRARDWSGLEDVVRGFERAWRGGHRPRIEDHLPTEPGPRGTVLVELVHAELEFRLKAGEAARVEQYLARFPDLAAEPAVVAELLTAEFEIRRKLDPDLTAQEYRLRFPDHAAPLDHQAGTVAQDSPSSTPTAKHATADPGSPAAPAAGSVPRYRLKRFHARGGLGEVFVAEDTELNRTVALKRMQARHRHDPDSRRRFLLEAEVTGQLEHPGIVPVYGLTRDADDQPCYAMRFIEGESLHEAIRRFHTPAAGVSIDPGEQALALRGLLSRFVAVCNAVAYAHSHGVVHRDLKPHNVMLGKYGETLVVDWGLAKPLAANERSAAPSPSADAGGEGTRFGEALGTPQYMSPEQAAGRWDEVGPPSDVYSLGATLYALLTGQSPLQAEDVTTVLEHARQGKFPRPRQVHKDVPVALEAVCLQAMALRPPDRYATPLALAADVEHWLADEPVSAYREPLMVRLRRRARRHRPAVAALAAGLLLTAVAVVAGLFLWQDAEQRRELAEQHSREQVRRGLDELRLSAEADQKLGLAALQGGPSPAAADVFRNALARLDSDPARLRQDPRLAELRAGLADRLGRVERLLEFYRLVNEAERLVAERQGPDADADREGLAHLEKALEQLGASREPGEALAREGADLEPAWRAQLDKDLYRALLLRAGLHAKNGLEHFLNPKAFEPTARATLESLKAVRRLRRESYIADTLEIYCQAGRRAKVTPLPAGRRQPKTGAGYYLSGVLHFWISQIPQNKNFAAWLSTQVYDYSGIDFANPLPTAEQALRTAATLEPRHYYTHAWLGVTLELSQNAQAAELAFATCVALQPKYRMGHSGRARAAYVQARRAGAGRRRAELFGRLFLAAEEWLRAAGVRPELPQGQRRQQAPGADELAHAQAFVWRAKAWHGLGKVPQALADLAEAIRLDPKGAGFAHEERGNIHQARSQHAQAIVEYDVAVRLSPRAVDNRFNRGVSLYHTGQFARSAADFSAVIKRSPRAHAAYRSRGTVRAELGQWREAIIDFWKVIELTPNNWEVRLALARALLSLDDKAGYQKVCAALLEVSERTPDVQWDRWVAWTCALDPAAAPLSERAVALAQRASARVPGHVDSLRALGGVLYRNGQTRAAADQLAEAVKAAGGAEDARAWLLLALAQQRLGRKQEAAKSFDRGEELLRRTEQPVGKGGRAAPALSWETRVEMRLLRQEAARALKKP